MDCWVVFTYILARNMKLDKSGCYGTSRGSAGHIKNVFLIVSAEQHKLRNAAYYWLEIWTMAPI